MDIEYVIDDGIEAVRILLPKSDVKDTIGKRKKWACESKPGIWGGGLTEDSVGVGLRGEMAFSQISGLPIDLQPKAAGTGGGSDFQIATVTFELKTKNMGSNHNHLLVRCETENGNPIALKSDIYVAARWVSKNQLPKHEVVHLMGWATKEELEQLPMTKARQGKHYNKEIAFSLLHPMRELMEYI